MRPPSILPLAATPGADLTAGQAAALALLLEAHDLAHTCHQDPWDWAVELHCLQAARVTPGSLRWLLCRGYAHHGVETTLPKVKYRSFESVVHLGLPERSCFVLTESGVAAARVIARAGLSHAEDNVAPVESLVPCWDQGRRELRVGSHVVKRFTQPAANQEAVLDAFQEDGWPPRLDDPLRPDHDQETKTRLRRTVHNLNRSQRWPGVRFVVCGNGQCVAWNLDSQRDSEDRAKTERVLT
jgi:hypothetical protein